jgi:hypothetical protein
MQTLLAAAAGGFGGAILGVVAATTMMGDADNDTQAANEASEPPAVAMVANEEVDDQ